MDTPPVRRQAFGPTAVKLVSRDQRAIYELPVDNVHARQIEDTFKLVRCHVEGSDHSVAFPNKQTGLYEKLNPKATYTVYGHPYNPAEIWKPRPKVDRHTKLIVPRDDIVIEGELQMLYKGWFKSTWSTYYFTLKYPTLAMYASREDMVANKKPEKSLKVDRSIKVSTCDLGRQHAFAFVLHGDEDTWYLSPGSAVRREEWMIWLQAISVFQAPKSWNEDEDESASTVRLPAVDDEPDSTPLALHLATLTSFDAGPVYAQSDTQRAPAELDIPSPSGRTSARDL